MNKLNKEELRKKEQFQYENAVNWLSNNGEFIKTQVETPDNGLIYRISFKREQDESSTVLEGKDLFDLTIRMYFAVAP